MTAGAFLAPIGIFRSLEVFVLSQVQHSVVISTQGCTFSLSVAVILNVRLLNAGVTLRNINIIFGDTKIVGVFFNEHGVYNFYCEISTLQLS